MYGLMSLASFAIRAAICYFTIENTPIFHNPLIAWVVGQIISIYVILRLISYGIVGGVFGYERGSDPTLGVILYFVVYVPLAFLLWGILALLTFMHVLPY